MSGLAVASLVSAALACPVIPLLVVKSGGGGVAAGFLLVAATYFGIVGSHAAIIAVDQSGGRVGGRRLAKLGLILSLIWASVDLLLLAAFCWIAPNALA